MLPVLLKWGAYCNNVNMLRLSLYSNNTYKHNIILVLLFLNRYFCNYQKSVLLKIKMIRNIIFQVVQNYNLKSY